MRRGPWTAYILVKTPSNFGDLEWSFSRHLSESQVRSELRRRLRIIAREAVEIESNLEPLPDEP
jgi:hypothetical protein